jgi:uncharacterized protein
MEKTTHKPGSFCTAVLRSRNVEQAATFYGEIMGWTTREVPGTLHRLLQSGGRTVAGIQPIVDGSDQWVPFVSVESVERTADEAVRLGGTIEHRDDVAGLARLATIRDPEGAVFGLWQPAPYQGAQLTEETGSLWWIEVLSNNVAGARNFYASLFGWESWDTAFEPFAAYTVFKRGETQEGGILPIGEDWHVLPRWSAIFAVADCDAVIAHANTLGASIVFVHTVPKSGRVGSISDPAGALFAMRGPVRS